MQRLMVGKASYAIAPVCNRALNCLGLSREWGNGLWRLLGIMETIIGEYIGTTIGIHSPIPY